MYSISNRMSPSPMGNCFHRPSSQFALMSMMMQVLRMLMQACMGQQQQQAPMFRRSPQFGRPQQPHCGLANNSGIHGSRHHCPNPVQNFLGQPSPPLPFNAGSQGDWAARLPGPLQRHAGAFQHYGSKYGVDPKFLAAISMLETGQGTSKAFRYKNNAMGVSNRSGPIAFGSVDASIERMARVLAKKDGPYAGRKTIGQIASVYCPVGAGNDVNGTNHHWPSMVSKFYTRLGGNPRSAVMA